MTVGAAFASALAVVFAASVVSASTDLVPTLIERVPPLSPDGSSLFRFGGSLLAVARNRSLLLSVPFSVALSSSRDVAEFTVPLGYGTEWGDPSHFFSPASGASFYAISNEGAVLEYAPNGNETFAVRHVNSTVSFHAPLRAMGSVVVGGRIDGIDGVFSVPEGGGGPLRLIARTQGTPSAGDFATLDNSSIVFVAGGATWWTDGTHSAVIAAEGTPQQLISSPHSLVEHNGAVWFAAACADGAIGCTAIWRTHGGRNGTATVMLPAISGDGFSGVSALGKLFFTARNKDGSGTFGNSTVLYVTVDGSDATALASVAPFLSSESAVAIGSSLVLAGNSSDEGLILWASDGTAAGTRAVSGAFVCPTQSTIVQWSGRVWMCGRESSTDKHGWELWSLDSSVGSKPAFVVDIFSGKNSSSVPRGWTIVDGRLFFIASDSSSSARLYEIKVTSDAGRIVWIVIVAIVGAGWAIGALSGIVWVIMRRPRRERNRDDPEAAALAVHSPPVVVAAASPPAAASAGDGEAPTHDHEIEAAPEAPKPEAPHEAREVNEALEAAAEVAEDQMAAPEVTDVSPTGKDAVAALPSVPEVAEESKADEEHAKEDVVEEDAKPPEEKPALIEEQAAGETATAQPGTKAEQTEQEHAVEEASEKQQLRAKTEETSEAEAAEPGSDM